LVAAAALSLVVTWADVRFAETGRAGARTIHEKYATGSNTVWFQGHWGFQYYMQQLGAKAVDIRNFRAAPGDIVAVPTTNSSIYRMGSQWFERERIDVPTYGWLATMNPGVGAGFYADVFGPLPFAVGVIPMERFRIFSTLPLRAN
jgi:hypothetical protein